MGGGCGDESEELLSPLVDYRQMTSLHTDGASVLALWNNEGVAIKAPKRPRDLNQRAKRVVDIATGDLNQTAPAAKELEVALSRKRGGARAEKFCFDNDRLRAGRGEASRVGGDVVDGVGSDLRCVDHDVADDCAVEEVFRAEIEVGCGCDDDGPEVLVGRRLSREPGCRR